MADLLKEHEVCTLVGDACVAAGGQSAWAAAHGVPPREVNDALHARRAPSRAILAALGLRKVVRYAPSQGPV